MSDQIRGRETSFRHLFEHNPSPMWIHDPTDLRFLEVNLATVSTYGYSRDEFLRMRVTDIRPPEDVPKLMARLRELEAAPALGMQRSGPWRHVTRAGESLEVEVISSRI